MTEEDPVALDIVERMLIRAFRRLSPAMKLARFSEIVEGSGLVEEAQRAAAGDG